MVVVEEEVYIIDQMSTSEPVVSVCPRCKKQVTTSTRRVFKDSASFTALFLCIACVCFVWVPFCLPTSYRTLHSCPNCGRLIGKTE